MSAIIYDDLLNLLKNKEYTKIEKQYQNSFGDFNKDKKILNFFAVYYLGKSNFFEVEKCLRLAQKIDKNYYNTIINYANLYICQKKINDAIPYLERAIHLSDNINYPLNLLANIYLKQKNLLSAKKLFIQLIKKEKENTDYLFKLGNILFLETKYNSSIKIYLKILKINKAFAKVYLELANCYFKLNNFDQSIKYLDKGIELFPNIVNLYLRKNEILRSYGKFEDALDVLNISSKIFPNEPSLIFAKSKLINYQKFSNEINSYELLFMSLSNSMSKAILGFALFKIFNDLKEYDKASRYLDEANKIKFNLTNYSKDLENQQFAFLRDNFTKNYVYKFFENKKSKIQGPIFIVGMQRSGSTLLEQMLAAHSKSNGLGEVDFYPIIFQKYFDDYDLALFKKSLSKLKKEQLAQLGNQYLKKVNFANNYISIDKLLSNFKLVAPILMSLPNAKIIHIFRNSADVCFSIYSNFFNIETMPWSSDQRSIINYLREYKLLMKHWNDLFPDSILNISYEALIEEPKKVLGSVLNFCNLEWEDQCLEFYKNKNKVETESLLQVRKKIDKSYVEKYNPYKKYYKNFFETNF